MTLYHVAISIIVLIGIVGFMAVTFLVSSFLADHQSDHLIRKTEPEIMGSDPIIPQPCPERRSLIAPPRSRAG